MSVAPFHSPADLSIENPVRRDANGVLRVGKTRVTLDTIINAYETGATVEEIVLAYDALALSQVYATIAYYLQNKAKLEPYLTARTQSAQDSLKELAQRQATVEIRQRLIARQANRGQA
ncbi:MAG TPA: DUF433 domain-containing protein [Anaerolineae bacterium]|jgi:uncharacterized protein (DUF433 family)